MNIGFNRVQVHLQPREVLRVYDPLGARVECVRGGLWITQDQDLEDHFLWANDALTLDRRGLTLIHAQEPSDVVLVEPAPPPAPSPHGATLAGRALDAWWSFLRRGRA